MNRNSGPVEAAPEGGAVSEVGRTGEGREPNNDTASTPQNSGRCGGRATPTGPTKGAENGKGGEHRHVFACEDTACPHCGCCCLVGADGCMCDADGCGCALFTLENRERTMSQCPTCGGDGLVPNDNAVAR